MGMMMERLYEIMESDTAEADAELEDQLLAEYEDHVNEFYNEVILPDDLERQDLEADRYDESMAREPLKSPESQPHAAKVCSGPPLAEVSPTITEPAPASTPSTPAIEQRLDEGTPGSADERNRSGSATSKGRLGIQLLRIQGLVNPDGSLRSSPRSFWRST